MNKNIEKFSAVSLRPYQQTAVDQSLSRFRNGERYSLVTLAVGLGKSWIMVFVALQFKRVVVLQPCIELVKQNHEKLANAGLDTTMIDSAHKGNWDADYIYTTPQTLCKHLDDLEEPDLLIIDECFTGDTLVATPSGYKKIKDIKVGDKVYNATGVGTVLAKTIKHTYATKTLELSNGKKIQGTYSHPIFTKHGWTRLEQVGRGETLFGIQDMPSLWENVSSTKGLLDKRKPICSSGLLQSLLRECSKYGESKPCPSQSKIYDWWERNEDTIASALSISTTKRGLGNRVCNKDRSQSMGWEWLSNLLQSRFSRPSSQNRNRSRWAISRLFGKKTTRPKENCVLGTVRVESVSHQKQTSPVPVYNLHVSGHPSYFAGGVLVHNCNVFWSGKMFDAIFSRWTHCKVLGLTATPHYYERKTVYKHGWMCSQTTVHSISEQYGESVMTMTRDEGRKQGYCPQITFTKLRIPLIEARHLENRPAYQPLLDEHINKLNVLLKTLNNAIIFCDSKVQAEWLSEIFNIPCIFGDTPKKQRERLVDWFNKNELPFVLTCKCLVRGFDKPDLENIVLLTNLNNSSEAEQIIGRLSRGEKIKQCYYIGRLNLNPPVVGSTEIIKIKRIN